jgi:hypothetical protein
MIGGDNEYDLVREQREFAQRWPDAAGGQKRKVELAGKQRSDWIARVLEQQIDLDVCGATQLADRWA